MKMFRVLNQYWDNFGNSTNEADYYVTYEQLEEFAKDWEMDIEDLLEQVQEI